jgi:hypothetical protein
MSEKGRRTDIMNEFSEFGVLTDGNDQTLDRSNDGWERQDSSGLVLFSSPVAVFEEGIEDSTETE